MLGKHAQLLLCCLLSISSGCASVFDSPSKRKSDSKKKEGWSWFKKPEYQEPKSMVAIWSEDTLIQPGKPVTRGFGGRIYFYNEKSQAIPVDGELIVYGFDDTAATKTLSASPSEKELEQSGRKFRFTAEQFTQHFSHSDLGASYSVWIPWDAVGGDQKKIMLMPTFIGKDERLVRGECARLSLAGKATSAVAANQPPNNTIQLASATLPTVQPNALAQLSPTMQIPNAIPVPPNVELGIKTTTIRMPQPIRAYAGNTQASNFAMLPQSPTSQTTTQSQQADSRQFTPAQTMSSAPLNSNHGPLPQLGHDIPTTGWIQQGRPPLAPPVSSVVSPPSQFPAPGLPTWQ